MKDYRYNWIQEQSDCGYLITVTWMEYGSMTVICSGRRTVSRDPELCAKFLAADLRQTYAELFEDREEEVEGGMTHEL